MTLTKKELESLEKAVLELDFEKADSIVVKEEPDDDECNYIDILVYVSIAGVQLTFVKTMGTCSVLYVNGEELVCDEGNWEYIPSTISVSSKYFDNLLKIAKRREKGISEIIEALKMRQKGTQK